MWILQSFSRDCLFLFLPGALGIAASYWIGGNGVAWVIYSALTTALIDSGHVYTTFLRTHFHPGEFRSRRIYWVAPLVLFLFFMSWATLSVPYLWQFVAYATLFHNLRQFYGLSKWYQRLNRRFCRVSDIFLYALCGIPFLAFHFRLDLVGKLSAKSQVFLYPQIFLFNTCLILYACVAACWIAFELRLYKNGVRELNRIFGIGTPAALYGFCFFRGTHAVQILLPLVLAHGIGYFGVLSQSLQRLQLKVYRSFAFALLIVLATAISCGTLEYWIGKNFNAYRTWMTALYLTPLFCHYLFDAFIWKSKHRDATLVFNAQTGT